MMDFNSSSSVSGQIIALVDAGMQQARARQVERQYLPGPATWVRLMRTRCSRMLEGAVRPRRRPGRDAARSSSATTVMEDW